MTRTFNFIAIALVTLALGYFAEQAMSSAARRFSARIEVVK